MNAFRVSALAASLLLLPTLWLSPGVAGDNGPVTVTFVDPDNYTDVHPPALLEDLQAFFAQRAARRVSDGQRLEIAVTDIDMAGGFDLSMGIEFSNVRQMRTTFPPRIDLAFTLSGPDGRVLKEGERRLQDLSYLMRPRPKTEIDPLHYEKLMIDEWLLREF